MKTIITFAELKRKMSRAINVEHWNELRDEAKNEVSMEMINRLDTSGYICEVLKPKKKKRFYNAEVESDIPLSHLGADGLAMLYDIY
jgi:hypothetical protein